MFDQRSSAAADQSDRRLEAGDEEYSVEIRSGTWTQKPQKYHARSLKALRARYADTRGNAELDAILEATGCLRWLAASG